MMSTAWLGLVLAAASLPHDLLQTVPGDGGDRRQRYSTVLGRAPAAGGARVEYRSRPTRTRSQNEVFLELTAWLHNTIRGDTKYLRWAKAEWSWFKGSGMINKSGLVNDGLNSRCASNHETTWTYNQGVILAGLAQLYQATRSTGLLRTAEGIATAAISHLTIGGVLHEPCKGTGCGNRTGGAPSRLAKFVRDLEVLAVTARTSPFSSFFRKQARSIEAHAPAGRSNRQALGRSCH